MTSPILTAAAVERGDGEPVDATGRAGVGVYVLPASFAQARLWFLHGLEPESPAYNIPLAYRLRGDLHLCALARSLSALARRHESLRTTFAVEDDEPVQVVAPPAPVPLPVVDLGALSRARRERELARRLETEARRPFDLALGPLFRALTLRLARREHVLFVGVHHAVADGWSLGIVARELSAGYASRRSGSAPPLDELPIQYADFAAWQRERLTGAAAEDLLSFWREALRDAPPVLELPLAKSRPAARSSRAGRRARRLDEAAVERLERLARERGATRFMAFLALFGLALHRLAPWSGRSDVVVGTPVAGRALEETEGLIGLFVNTLVLRFDLAGEPTGGELLERVRDTCLAAFAHQELPFERLVEELAPERGLGHDPLVQVAFVLRDEPADQALRLPRLEAEALELGTGTVKFDLALSLPAAAGGAAACLDFRADLVEPADAARLLECLEALLGAAAADPRRRIGELPLLSAAARHQLLHEWNPGSAAAPLGEGETLHGRFAERARERPDAPAVLGEGQVVSYGELARRAAALARGLRRRGVGPGDLVGLYCDRVPDLAAAILGILETGAAYLPLDPSYPRERLAFMLADAGVAAVVAQESRRAELPEAGAPVLLLDREPEGGTASGGEPASGGPGSRAYVIYTSGSTGRPKGVQVSHGNVLRLMDRTEPWYRFGADDAWT
ncbi:MAG TPA: condensation domain-containing protein, partial [Thermoanaerobaculia bacterium]|nr:condensation domain-containing protein [Thermoanaerobaculia bacterium]